MTRTELSDQQQAMRDRHQSTSEKVKDILEPLYTVAEIAQRWKCDAEKVTQIFANEPGVRNLGTKPDVKKRKRGYRILRVPSSVLARVESQFTAVQH
jgi:hypothetical protein